MVMSIRDPSTPHCECWTSEVEGREADQLASLPTPRPTHAPSPVALSVLRQSEVSTCRKDSGSAARAADLARQASTGDIRGSKISRRGKGPATRRRKQAEWRYQAHIIDLFWEEQRQGGKKCSSSEVVQA